jgi:hypothetical protein
LMATSAIVTWYLLGYVRPSSVPAAPSVSAVWATILQALSLVISPSRWGYWMAAGWAVLLLTTVTVMRLGLIAWRSPLERPRALGLCAVTVALLGVATSVGVSRSGSGPSAGLASRYTTILAPLISVLYVTWLLYGPASARRAIHISLLALICAGLPAQSHGARVGPESLRPVRQNRKRPRERHSELTNTELGLSVLPSRPSHDL